MYDFHADRNRYFLMQYFVANDSVIPFIEKHKEIKPGMQVLDIGCGECGVLKAFLERGCTGTGIDTDGARFKEARSQLGIYIRNQKLQLFNDDIYEADRQMFTGRYDVIILKDVIEHIHQQERLLSLLKTFLAEGGMIFFAFPPWQMPFGGHQQVCRSKWLSRMPYIHLLPLKWYRSLLQKLNEPVDDLLDIRETRLSIERFQKMLRRQDYSVCSRKLYLLNPIYRYKFRLPPLQQPFFLSRLPGLRNLVTTCAYYLVTANDTGTMPIEICTIAIRHRNTSPGTTANND